MPIKSEFQSRKWRKDMNFQHGGNVIVKNNEVYINGEKCHHVQQKETMCQL